MDSYPEKPRDDDEDSYDEIWFDEDSDPDEIPMPGREDAEIDEYLARKEKKRRQQKRRRERHDKYHG
jgi:hypothetical protein